LFTFTTLGFGMTYPSGKVLSYDYGTSNGLNDVIGRLESLKEGTLTLESYKYLGMGTLVERTQDQAGTRLTYLKQGSELNGEAADKYEGLDRFGRVVYQRWINSGGTSIDRYGYSYDRNSNRISKTNALYSVYDEGYAYDGLDRLTQVDRLSGTSDYDHGYGSQARGLDALGNMASVVVDGVSESRTHNDQNQLTAIGSNSLAYDNNGNSTTDDYGHTLVYDAWNRLVEVKHGGTTLRTYAYDGIGRRVTEDTPSTDAVEVYYSDQWQVLEERTGASGLTLHAQYVWSPVYVDALVLRDYDANASGTFTVGERVYALQDANFDVTALVTWQTGTTWAVSERFLYDPYGKFTTYDGSWNVQDDTLAWNYQHQGLRLDRLTGSNTAGVSTDGTGWYDNRYRVYSSTMMRFGQQDPMGYVDGASLYVYLKDHPSSAVDPEGTQSGTSPNAGYPGLAGFPHRPIGYHPVTPPMPPIQPNDPAGIWVPVDPPTFDELWTQYYEKMQQEMVKNMPPPPLLAPPLGAPVPPGGRKFLQRFIGVSICVNGSSRPLLIWNTGGYGYLPPGASTSGYSDDADWVFYKGKWYKVSDGETCRCTDTVPPTKDDVIWSRQPGLPSITVPHPIQPGPDSGGWQPPIPSGLPSYIRL
jgi:RHS repeat-associated protein